MSNVYQIISERIKTQLKEGTIPWKQPWFSLDKRNVRGNNYKGINRLLLAGEKDTVYFSFKQIKDYDAHIMKGGTPSIVVLSKPIDMKNTNSPEEFAVKDTNPTDEEKKNYQGDQEPIVTKNKIWYMKYYKVWGASKIEGLPDSILDELKRDAVKYPPIENFISRSGVKVVHGNIPGYSELNDTIMIPDISSFSDTASYYTTYIRQLVKWTGHSTRLARFSAMGKTENDRIVEELIGEFGAAFFCNVYDIVDTTINHSSYIDYWLKNLEEKTKILFIASALSESACTFLIDKCWKVSEVKAS